VTTLQRGSHEGDTCQNAVYYENSKLKREEEEEASLFDTSTKLYGGLLSESVALIRSEVWKRGSSQVTFYQNCHSRDGRYFSHSECFVCATYFLAPKLIITW